MDINTITPQTGNMLDENNVTHNLLDKFTGSKKEINTDHNYIHEKKRFTAFLKTTLATSSTLEISLKTPAIGFVHYRGIRPSPTADKLDIQIFEGATIDVEGIVINSTNRSRTGIVPSSIVELKHGTTFTDDGTHLEGLDEFYPGDIGNGAVRNGGGDDSNEEVVLNPDTVYRILITNGSGSSNTIGLIFNWYEEKMG